MRKLSKQLTHASCLMPIACCLNENNCLYKPSSVTCKIYKPVTIYLRYRLPGTSSGQPGRKAGHFISSLFGLAPDGVCRASQFLDCWCALTAPFQLEHLRQSAKSVEFRINSNFNSNSNSFGVSRRCRFLFCGTFRGVAPPGCYPASYPMELGLSSDLAARGYPRQLFSLISLAYRSWDVKFQPLRMSTTSNYWGTVSKT